MPYYIEFEIVGPITNRRTIAVGNRIRELQRLVHDFGPGRWRKMSGEAYIRFSNGDVVFAEIHWYEAHGIGMKDFGYKRTLE
jgi:hypothetical protein